MLIEPFISEFIFTMCEHVARGVNISAITRQLDAIKDGKFFTKPDCDQCSKRGAEVWLCLSCGFRGCGRLDNGHMITHYEVNKHPISMNLRTTMIWCYECDDEVLGDSMDNVRSLVTRTIARLSGKKKVAAGSATPPTTTTRSEKSLKGCRGIVNIGNTCFLAASMQCLSHTPPFQKILRHCPPFIESSNAQQKLVKAIRDFFVEQWGDPWSTTSRAGGAFTSPVNPDDILTCVQRINSLFHGYQQHDSQEFLRFLLCTIHEEVRRKVKPSDVKILSTIITSPVLSSTASPGTKQPAGDPSATTSRDVYTSLISDVFMGQTCSTVTCLECHKDSKCIEDFYDLSLPIPTESFTSKKGDESNVSNSSWFLTKARSLFGLSSNDSPVSITDCLTQFTRTEKLTDSNSYNCETCKRKTESLKRISIHRLPEILVLHLKRFRHDGGYYGGSKITKTVTFPVASDFDLSPFVSDIQPPALSTKYRLCGFVVHMGSLSGGHYIAYCRHKTTGQWFCFDDSRVTPVNDIAVIESAEPYVMFFQKVAEKTTIRERKTLKTDPVICGTNGPSLYLPRRWVCAVKTMATIPPIANNDLVCPHFHPSTMSEEIARMQFQQVSTEFANRAINRYGVLGLTSDLLGIDKCLKCEEWIKCYNHRLAAEHKLVSSLDTKGIEAGQVWFYIDSAWITTWRAYLKQGAIVDRNKACDPGPIDNKELDKKMKAKDTKVKMTTDFVAVNHKVWSVFVHFHGSVGPSITRDSLDPNSTSGSEIGQRGSSEETAESLGIDSDTLAKIKALRGAGA